MNCRTQPATKSARAAIQRFETNKQTGIIKIERAIIGMPKLCVIRLTGCSWLCEYSSTHSSQDLPPIMLMILPFGTCRSFYIGKAGLVSHPNRVRIGRVGLEKTAGAADFGPHLAASPFFEYPGVRVPVDGYPKRMLSGIVTQILKNRIHNDLLRSSYRTFVHIS